MNISNLDTPAIVIDIDVMERNLRRMAEYCTEHRIQLRPHTKTHKIPEPRTPPGCPRGRGHYRGKSG